MSRSETAAHAAILVLEDPRHREKPTHKMDGNEDAHCPHCMWKGKAKRLVKHLRTCVKAPQ